MQQWAHGYSPCQSQTWQRVYGDAIKFFSLLAEDTWRIAQKLWSCASMICNLRGGSFAWNAC